MSLWKSESPVSIVQDDWKLCGWFVKVRSIRVGLAGFFLKSRILYEGF